MDRLLATGRGPLYLWPGGLGRLARVGSVAILLLGACSSVPSPASQATGDSTLLFRSGFEEGVSLSEPYNDGGGTWYQDLRGADESGYAWPMKIWGAEGVMQVLVDSSLAPDDYLVNRLETTVGPDGKDTRALHLVQLAKVADDTQDPFIIETGGVETSDLYVSYWMRYPEDLAERLGPDGWFAFMEWKTCCNDNRIAAYVYSDTEAKLYWYVHGDNETDEAPVYEEFWYSENDLVPVPVGDWFKVEVFLHRSTSDDGRFLWAVDGETVIDYRGPTKREENFNRWMPFTLYSNADAIDIWIDDIEVRDSRPDA